MILTGEFAGGERLTQEDIARLLGVSTMPVREALLRLAAEGFVDVAAGRSFTVVQMTAGDVRDVFWIHATIAGELTRRACSNADDALIARLHLAHTQFMDAERDGDAGALGASNWEFHRAINLAAASPKLLRMLRSSMRLIPQSFYALVPDWTAASDEGHERIISSLEQRDPAAARDAAEAHVRDAGDILIRYFTASGYWTRPEEVK